VAASIRHNAYQDTETSGRDRPSIRSCISDGESDNARTYGSVQGHWIVLVSTTAALFPAGHQHADGQFNRLALLTFFLVDAPLWHAVPLLTRPTELKSGSIVTQIWWRAVVAFEAVGRVGGSCWLLQSSLAANQTSPIDRRPPVAGNSRKLARSVTLSSRRVWLLIFPWVLTYFSEASAVCFQTAGSG
jgi:hypothetical protein